jgi:hypothetical protein
MAESYIYLLNSLYGLLRFLRILAEPSVPSEANNTEYGLAKDAAIHLRCTQLTVNKDDGYLLDFESTLVGGEFHLYLVGVTFEAYLVEFDSLKYFTSVTFEPCGGVLHLDASDKLHIFGCIIRHQYTSHRPIDNVYTTHIT